MNKERLQRSRVMHSHTPILSSSHRLRGTPVITHRLTLRGLPLTGRSTLPISTLSLGGDAGVLDSSPDGASAIERL